MNKDHDLLSMSVRDFLAAVAEKTPTPGGGSVAGTVGALGVALGEMSLNFTRGKKKFAQHEPFYQHLSARLAKARSMFIDLVADDVAAYGFYTETAKLPDGPTKDETMQLALSASIDVPREMTKLAIAIMEDLLALAGKCNPYLLSDLMAGATLAAAAARLSDYNVRINVPQLTDAQSGKEVQQSSANDLARADQLLTDIEKACGRAQ